MFSYKDKTQTIGSFTQESEFIITFKAAAKVGENPTFKANKNDELNSALFKKHNKTKECHVASIYLSLSRLLGFCQDINCVLGGGVKHQIALKRNDKILKLE